jgi:putative redox protein
VSSQPNESGSSVTVAELTGEGRFQTEIRLRNHVILADEPIEVGGLATGPTPYELLSASLAACTTMTIRLYAEHKGFALPPFRVEVAHSRASGGRDLFARIIRVDGAVDEERRAKLLEIANKCPVHRTMERGFQVSTELGEGPPAGEPAEQHMIDMEDACA